jgi:hypothetical protein
MTARTTVLVVVALVAGIAIAIVDSSPGWDSTGITAGLLVIAAAVTAGIAPTRPWLWALLVGLPTPIVEIVRFGSVGSLLALAFAVVGAAIGWAVARTSGRGVVD